MKRRSGFFAPLLRVCLAERPNRRDFWFAIGLVSGLWAPALAGEQVTLDALVTEIVARNPELQFYDAEIAAARAGRVAAGAWSNPELSTELGHKSVHDLDGHGIGDGPIWAVSLSQTFEFPGRLGLRKALADRQIALAELGREQFRSALAIRARALGYGLLAAQQRAEATAEVSKRFQDLLAVLVQRAPAGVAPLLETRIIEASAFSLNRRASEASNAARRARFELNQLRGLPVSTPVDVVPTELTLEPAPPLDTLVASARERNFDVRTRVAELEQQGIRVRLSSNERWPAVKVGPFASGERASDEERVVGLGVSVPLPLLNQNTGNIENAKARQAQAEVLVNVTLREVERKVAAAVNAYETFRTEIARWPRNAAQKFREAARAGDEHYRLGALPVTTYTELQKQYLEAVDTILGTQADALEARQQVELLTGSSLGAVSVERMQSSATGDRPTPARPGSAGR